MYIIVTKEKTKVLLFNPDELPIIKDILSLWLKTMLKKGPSKILF